jgi:hypothetical protein
MTHPIGSSSQADLRHVAWLKSSASSANGGCLEVAFLEDGRVALRDNEDLRNPPFIVTRHVWECFLDGATNGEFAPPS